MLRALGPWGILIVAGSIGMYIWRFEARRLARLDDVVDDRYLDDLADEYDELFAFDEAVMPNGRVLPLGPDDCPDFIETLERFVRPSE